MTPFSKALRRRKTASSDETVSPDSNSFVSSSSTAVETDEIRSRPSPDMPGMQEDTARRVRIRAPDMEEIEPRFAVAEADTADAERNEQDPKSGRKVEIEKSNVLMM